MAKVFERALIIALIAASSASIGPARCEQNPVVASLSSPTMSTDPILEKALNIIRQKNEARKNDVQRREIRPATDAQIVRTRHYDLDRTRIMGIDSGASIPM